MRCLAFGPDRTSRSVAHFSQAMRSERVGDDDPVSTHVSNSSKAVRSDNFRADIEDLEVDANVG